MPVYVMLLRYHSAGMAAVRQLLEQQPLITP